MGDSQYSPQIMNCLPGLIFGRKVGEILNQPLKTGDHPAKPVGGRHKKRIIHVSYRLEGGKSVTDNHYYIQIVSFGKVGMSLRLTFCRPISYAKMRRLVWCLPLYKTSQPHLSFCRGAGI